MRGGELLAAPAVAEGTTRYRPGASAELGSSGMPGTFGVARTNKGVRIVWHYSAHGEERTFTISYRLAGLAQAWDDVVDVNLKVWGDEWKVPLGQLTAKLSCPTAAGSRAWGHPVWCARRRGARSHGATLRAENVPAGQWVELHAVFPRRLLASTAGTIVRPGKGLPLIVANEATGGRDTRRTRPASMTGSTTRDAPRSVLLLLGLGPRRSFALATWLVYGRERRAGYDREYEQEPPSDLAPALVPALVTEEAEGRLARVHRDAVRPDSPRALHDDAGHDRPQHVGRPPPRAGRGSEARAEPGRRARTREQSVAEIVDDALPKSESLLSKAARRDPRGPHDEQRALRDVQESRQRRDSRAALVRRRRPESDPPRRSAARGRRREPVLRRRSPLAPRRPAVERHRDLRARRLRAAQRGAARLDRLHPADDVEAARARRATRGAAGGCVPPLSLRLPRLDVAPPASLELWERYLV